jgi:hypothetical protein
MDHGVLRCDAFALRVLRSAFCWFDAVFAAEEMAGSL